VVDALKARMSGSNSTRDRVKKPAARANLTTFCRLLLSFKEQGTLATWRGRPISGNA